MAIQTAYFTLTDATFEDTVLNNPQPVLVDFWAPWCGPCHIMAPIVEELASELAERVTVGKVNVDDNPSLSAQYGIRSIPTLLLFKDGEVVDRAIGVVPKPALVDKLQDHLTT